MNEEYDPAVSSAPEAADPVQEAPAVSEAAAAVTEEAAPAVAEEAATAAEAAAAVVEETAAPAAEAAPAVTEAVPAMETPSPAVPAFRAEPVPAATEVPAYQAPASPYAQPAQQPVQPAYPYGTPQAVPTQDSRPPRKSPYAPMTSVGMAVQLLLMNIPVIGLILSIVWACGVCRKIARRNLARAWLILLIAGILIVVALAIVARFCFTDQITQIFEQAFPGYTIKWG